MPRYVHFEHYVDDAEKAIRFYDQAFGWTSEKWGDQPYWLITSGPDGEPGINGGIGAYPAPNGQKVVNTIGVDNIDDAVKKAQDAGATVVQEKSPIPQMGWVAYLTDPTGIVFGLFAMDQSAV